LAEVAGVSTPILDSLITLGSVIIGQDCRKTGRTAKEMGITGMDITAFKAYIQNGE
jgi:opine dehydrogenase